MKIAFIGQKGIPVTYGGIERHVEELAMLLSENPENEISVYCRRWYTKRSQQASNLKSIRKIKRIFIPSIKTKQLDTISHVFGATLHALTQDYDIIHYQGIGPTLFSFIPKLLKPKTQVIATYHCADYQHQKWGLLGRLILFFGEITSVYFPHQTIAVSKNIKKYLENRYRKSILYIPNGVNINYQEIGKEREKEILQNWNLKPNQYFLTVNRLVRHKGIHHLIKAYQKLYPKALARDKKLVIVGGSAFTDDYIKDLKKMAGKNPNIIFTDYQIGENLQTLFKNAYTYIQPSEAEGLPIAVLEALSFSKCVITSDIPANREIVENCGLLFKNTDFYSLYQALFYLNQNPGCVKKFGIKGKEYVEKYYTWEKVVTKTEDLYKRLIKEQEASDFGHSFEILLVKTV